MIPDSATKVLMSEKPLSGADVDTALAEYTGQSGRLPALLASSPDALLLAHLGNTPGVMGAAQEQLTEAYRHAIQMHAAPSDVLRAEEEEYWRAIGAIRQKHPTATNRNIEEWRMALALLRCTLDDTARVAAFTERWAAFRDEDRPRQAQAMRAAREAKRQASAMASPACDAPPMDWSAHLRALSARGIIVQTADKSHLRLSGAEKLTDAEREVLRVNKPAILAVLHQGTVTI